MRVLLGSVAAIAMITAASAADLPVRPPAPAPVMAPVWNWNGFYIGVNGGYSWGRAIAIELLQPAQQSGSSRPAPARAVT